MPKKTTSAEFIPVRSEDTCLHLYDRILSAIDVPQATHGGAQNKPPACAPSAIFVAGDRARRNEVKPSAARESLLDAVSYPPNTAADMDVEGGFDSFLDLANPCSYNT